MVDLVTLTASIFTTVNGLQTVKESVDDIKLKAQIGEFIDALNKSNIHVLQLINENAELQAMQIKTAKELNDARDSLELKKRYRLKETKLGKFIYVLNPPDETSGTSDITQPEPRHAVCIHCFNDGKVRILQSSYTHPIIVSPGDQEIADYKLHKLTCSNCKFSCAIHSDELTSIYD
ncbi:MAG: hypothetical protein ACRBHB_17130 [Arenicella sp.]